MFYTEEQLRAAFERKHAAGYAVSFDQVFARRADGEYKSLLLQQAWETFKSAVEQAQSLLPDRLGPFDAQLAPSLRTTCAALGAQNLPDSDEELWVNGSTLLENALQALSK